MLDSEGTADEWPRLRLEPEMPRPGEAAKAILADTVPWVYIKLLVNGSQEAEFVRYAPNPLGGEWIWSFTVPEEGPYELSFYHDCDKGCVLWARHNVDPEVNRSRHPSTLIPTKLGVVSPNPERQWHQRSGWVVEIGYAALAEADYWGVDPLAVRVQREVNAGHRVLLRVDYDQGQSIPHDGQALEKYLSYLRRLARDQRMQGVYGVIVGSGYNALANNSQSAQAPVSPAWYARVFNGYQSKVGDSDNVVAVLRAENPSLRVLVGPIQASNGDQTGEQPYALDLPWLSYFNSVAAALDESARARSEAGIAQAWPDGFAVQAMGMLDSPPVDGAQTGFRVFQDWLAVINSHRRLANLPVYITAANSYSAEAGVVPARNYEAGWLTKALEMITGESQIQALCWFVDYLPVDSQWQGFSLTAPEEGMIEAAREFDQLLGELDEPVNNVRN